MLGGSVYQTFAIKEAIKMGLHVITCDYLPNNPGHKYAHEYYNVSTTDKDAVLELAKELKVDGVVAYASDPAAPTAAYVCEKLGLPTSPYKSVEILSKKHLFRQFLTDNGFNVPKAKSYTSYEAAEKEIDNFKFPVMIKPVDSSGSKGINKLMDKSGLRHCVEDALSYSRDKIFIIEEFIVKKGFQISGDAFSVDGKLVFYSFGNEYYSNKAEKDFAPLGECWPSLMPKNVIDNLVSELQRLISLLKMKTTAYNVEGIWGEDGKIYILEMGARSGGSLIPQITTKTTGVDMVPYVIKGALGENCSDLKMMPEHGYWSNYMVNSKKTGTYAGICYDSVFEKNNLVDFVTDIKIGDNVHVFRDAEDAIGTLIVKYSSQEQMFDMIGNLDKFVHVIVK